MILMIQSVVDIIISGHLLFDKRAILKTSLAIEI